MLVNQGADVGAKDQDNNTALHVAAKQDLVQVVVVLLDNLSNSEVSMVNKDGLTPLQVALNENNDSVAEKIIRSGLISQKE